MAGRRRDGQDDGTDEERAREKEAKGYRRENIARGNQGTNPSVAGVAFGPVGKEDPAFPAAHKKFYRRKKKGGKGS